MAFDNWLKILTVLGGIASFLWGVHQWREKSSQELEARTLESERLVATRRIEATKPFLDRQLALYAEVTKIAAQVATQRDSDAGKKALSRFLELYWGELALVENRAVEGAMVRMHDAISRNAPATELEQASLAIAHACRESLDRSWGISAWTSPDGATSTPGRKP